MMEDFPNNFCMMCWKMLGDQHINLICGSRTDPEFVLTETSISVVDLEAGGTRPRWMEEESVQWLFKI